MKKLETASTSLVGVGGGTVYTYLMATLPDSVALKPALIAAAPALTVFLCVFFGAFIGLGVAIIRGSASRVVTARMLRELRHLHDTAQDDETKRKIAAIMVEVRLNAARDVLAWSEQFSEALMGGRELFAPGKKSGR